METAARLLPCTMFVLACTGTTPAPPWNQAAVDAFAAEGFVPIAPGTVVVGSPDTEPCHARNNENEVEVILTYAFEAAKTETTQGTWEALGYPNPVAAQGDSLVGADLPVSYVSWYDALAFANRLSTARGLEECYDLSGSRGTVGSGCEPGIHEEFGACGEGFRDGGNAFVAGDLVRKREADYWRCNGYRLPTYAEAEYIARAGTTTANYAGDAEGWDDGESACDQVHERTATIGWSCENSGGRAHPVATLAPNAWGLYDTIGNLRELRDGFFTGFDLAIDEGKEPPLTNPIGDRQKEAVEGEWPNDADASGSSFNVGACLMRASVRLSMLRTGRTMVHGFRPVRTLPAD